MNIKKIINENLTSSPRPLVFSYAGGKEIVTINLDVKKQDIPSPAAQQSASDADAECYQCTTLSITSDERTTATDIVRIIAQEGMTDSINAEFLRTLAAAFHIDDYDTLAALLVSGRYTYAEELSCHRKALLGDKQPLMELNSYVEQCKRLAAECFDKTPDASVSTSD